ncbi:MAG: hypothetical protein O6943_06040 [Bacteroidetes bacterium]|nr:hypothetical protein [Bacteroidota bacterium]
MENRHEASLKEYIVDFSGLTLNFTYFLESVFKEFRPILDTIDMEARFSEIGYTKKGAKRAMKLMKRKVIAKYREIVSINTA